MANKDLQRALVDRIRDLCEPVVIAEGMELVDLEYVREGRGRVLRIYIDKEGGVDLDDCQSISRQVEKLLDVEDLIEESYSLEVSSPGIERPLKKPEHFERFAGSRVAVRTFAPIGDPPRKNFRGRLLGIRNDDEIEVEIDGKIHTVPLEKVAKAHLDLDPDELAEALRRK